MMARHDVLSHSPMTTVPLVPSFFFFFFFFLIPLGKDTNTNKDYAP